MINRRESAKALALTVAGSFFGMNQLGLAESAQASGKPATNADPPSRVKKVLQQLLPPLEGKEEATLVTVSYAPGASSRPHRHPGPVFGYILEGSVVIQVEPNPPRTYRQGEAFYEPPMHIHRISRNASKTRPAQLLAFQITKPGQPLTIPVD